MKRIRRLCTFPLAGALAIAAQSPTASADDSVTYEIDSSSVSSVDLEYRDIAGRILLTNVPLPWRTTVTLADPHSASSQGAQIRADWRPRAAPRRWVTVRILQRDKVICESTLDIGNATCYGATPFISQDI
jgi:hypothetical protein